ncbi:MAG: hypothetical protein K2N74_04480, partial [Clostridiales bacterium]|nr:hypothetical protein [Clostridiales bacterium]
MKLTQLKGITEKRAKEFAGLGITDTEGLIKYFPRSYLDMTCRVSVREVFHNDTALLACRLVRVEPVRRTGRVTLVRAWLEQGGDTFCAVWFNMPYLAPRLKAGEYLFYGRVQNRYGQISLVNPTFEPLEKNMRLKGLVPVYPLRASLTQRVVRSAVSLALRVEDVQSVIPYELQKRYALAPLKEAYFTIHAPETQQKMQKAAERIALEEYFTLISAFKLIKGDKNEARLRKYSVTESDVKEFQTRFPFTFTAGQKQAVNDIFDNLTSPLRMNRLLQGDVGSGKTAVALKGIFMAVKSGFQAVYISKTEVLAAQN